MADVYTMAHLAPILWVSILDKSEMLKLQEVVT